MSRAVGLRSILDRINAWMHAWKYTLANLIVLGLIALTMFGFDPWIHGWTPAEAFIHRLPYLPWFLFLLIVMTYASMKYDVEGVWLTPRAQLLYMLVGVSLLIAAWTYRLDAAFAEAFIESSAHVLPTFLPILFLLIYRDVKKGPPGWRLRLAGVGAYLILLALTQPLTRFPFTRIIFAPVFIYIILIGLGRWPFKREPLKGAEDTSKA